MNKIILLGTGTSTGVPILGCNCDVCNSTDLRNKRLRTSAIIETKNKKKILIDASPDLRTQLLREDIRSVDSVVITHDHADHTHGMDDLRPFGFIAKKSLPVFTNPETAKSLKSKFPYIFDRDQYFGNKPILGGGIPLLDLKLIDSPQVQISEETFEFLTLPHGHGHTLGVVHEKMAYLTDCNPIPPEVLETLRERKLKLLLIDCLRLESHQTHLHLDRTLEYISYIQPDRAILIHMGHELSYEKITAILRERDVKNVSAGVDRGFFFY